MSKRVAFVVLAGLALVWAAAARQDGQRQQDSGRDSSRQSATRELPGRVGQEGQQEGDHHQEEPQLPQPVQDEFSDRLIGSWQGEGTVNGAEVREHEQWEWILGHQFVRMTYHAAMTMGEQQMNYEGHSYCRPLGEGHYRGYWFDNAGETAPFEGSLENDQFTIQWTESDEGAGKVVYSFTQDGNLSAVYYMAQEDGSFQEVGRTTLHR